MSSATMVVLKSEITFDLPETKEREKNEKNLLPKQGTEKYEDHAWIFAWWWNNTQIKAMENWGSRFFFFFLSLQIMQRWRRNTKLNDRQDSTYRNGTKHWATLTVTARYHVVDQIVTLFSIEENLFSYQNFDLKGIFIALKFT